MAERKRTTSRGATLRAPTTTVRRPTARQDGEVTGRLSARPDTSAYAAPARTTDTAERVRGEIEAAVAQGRTLREDIEARIAQGEAPTFIRRTK